MQVRPIKTPADHRAALEEIDRLMQGGARLPATASTSSARTWRADTADVGPAT